MKKILYLGLDPVHFQAKGEVIHYPVIKIVPRSLDTPEIKAAFERFAFYTHLIFTSKSAVSIFSACLDHFSVKIEKKTFIAIGSVTARALLKHGLPVDLTAKEETQEGVIELLSRLDLKQARIFFPRSSLSRPELERYLVQKDISFCSCTLYDTIAQQLEPVPDLKEIDQIIFTSPSTVDAFLKIYPHIPSHIELCPIGPITKACLVRNCKQFYDV